MNGRVSEHATSSERGGVGIDADGFVAFVEPHWRAMWWAVRRFASSGSEEEALQEALLSAWHSRRSFDPNRGSARAWLVTIAVRSAQRSRSSHETRVSELTLGSGPQPSAEEAVDVGRAVAALPERQRIAVGLYYFVGLSVEDVATAMSIRPGTVKATLASARAHLRAVLGEEYR